MNDKLGKRKITFVLATEKKKKKKKKKYIYIYIYIYINTYVERGKKGSSFFFQCNLFDL